MSMVPPSKHPEWKKLVTGERDLKTTQLAINMLLTNIRLKYKRDPSPANVNQLIEHMRELFVKFENTFKAELNQLFG
jgi:hypothetical protein